VKNANTLKTGGAEDGEKGNGQGVEISQWLKVLQPQNPTVEKVPLSFFLFLKKRRFLLVFACHILQRLRWVRVITTHIFKCIPLRGSEMDPK